MKHWVLCLVLISARTVLSWGQEPQEILALLGFPDTIITHAKILTVDDQSFTNTLGTIAEALAIRDGKILAIGNNEEIGALAGPRTQRINLGGRTMVPGFILGHNHPWDYTPTHPEIMEAAVPEEIAVQRFLTGPPADQIRRFPEVFEEAVQAAKPGAWIRIIFLWDQSVDPDDPAIHFAGTKITKEQLDRGAPNNPVEVRSRDTIIRQGREGLINQVAVDLIRREGVSDALADMNNLEQEEETGVMSGLNVYRMFIPQVMFKNHLDVYAEMMRLSLSWWTGTGQTTVGGFLYHQPNVLKAYRWLDREGRLPARVAWGWGSIHSQAMERAFQDPFLVADLASREGTGTDHMWYYGTGSTGGGCVSMQPIVSNPKVIRGGSICLPTRLTYRRGGRVWRAMYELVKTGGRLMASHETGDVEIDNILNLIEEASREGGLSPEEIRSRKHTADHMQGWPRPSQIGRIKDLGLIASGTNLYIYQDSPRWLRDYGEKSLDWVVPRKSVVDAGILTTMELDKPYYHTDATVFTALSWAVTRKAMDGKIYAPHQRISREIALKSGTIWGAHYVLKERVLGSLEPGKFADFLVLDRDYLTVPETELTNIKIIMTAVAGKIEHLVPSLARELGKEPAGAQVELGGPAAAY